MMRSVSPSCVGWFTGFGFRFGRGCCWVGASLWCVLSADALFLEPGSCAVVASGADGEWVPVVRGSW